MYLHLSFLTPVPEVSTIKVTECICNMYLLELPSTFIMGIECKIQQIFFFFFFFFWGGGGVGGGYQCEKYACVTSYAFSHSVRYWYEILDFFTCCEELVQFFTV